LKIATLSNKSLCTVAQTRNYTEAKKFCEGNNMRLFIIDSKQVQDEMQNDIGWLQSTEFWWINGQRDNNKWFVENACYTKLFYEHAVWYNGDSLGGGNCVGLVRKAAQERRIITGVSCNLTTYFICEFSTPKMSTVSTPAPIRTTTAAPTTTTTAATTTPILSCDESLTTSTAAPITGNFFL
jgi:hypothetical protein